ncbi:pyridoxamine 5'-phosphate oxidase family protein [Ilumatobacter coccineus]|jgi:uncharacterized protein|uniref:Pyridoxamine 5'-phosphate oxidase family protein n=1 Tax=Ilumatobacter coccineus (strain NBRC 103263 / KCTC 29153 / YM16-304) TaxID=1313172 RepID=A0A6C7E5D3_ILUCY|nr:pyridoxamine 5'-phosphate oxidase family protein [Ilumatobacter coccineus]BAN02047.1 hypothetical protein YM304_17330 [Ilumatobacter coccineus YM16-304]
MNDIEDLGNSTCWSLLRQTPVGRIALQGGDDIEVFPVNFVVDHGSVVFRTGAGTKLRLAEDGQRATFEADRVDDTSQLVWSVVLKGPVAVVRGRSAIVDTFDVDISTWHAGPKPTYVRLTPDVVTGRRFAPDPQLP